MTGTQSPAGRLLAVSVLVAVSAAEDSICESYSAALFSKCAHNAHVHASILCHTLCSLCLLRSAWR